MDNQMILSPETQRQISDIVISAEGFSIKKIEDDLTKNIVADSLKKVKKEISELTEARLKITRPIDESKAQAMDLFREPIKQRKEFESYYKELLGEYLSALEDKRLAIKKAVDDKIRKERERIEAVARKQREKEEKANQDAEEKRLTAKAEADDKKRDQLLKDAKKDDRKAQVMSGKALMTEAVADTVVAPKVKTAKATAGTGISLSKKYFVIVENPADFIASVLESKRFEYLTINTSFLDREAQTKKGAISWPGISVQSRTVVGSRGA